MKLSINLEPNLLCGRLRECHNQMIQPILCTKMKRKKNTDQQVTENFQFVFTVMAKFHAVQSSY